MTLYKKTQEEEANFIQYENVKTDNMISATQCLNGYLASSQSASQPPISTTYDNIGRLTRLTDQAGTQTQFSYDHRGLVTQHTDAFGLNTSTGLIHSSNTQTLASYQYTLDGNGNRRQIIIEHEPLAPAALINKTDTQNYNAHKNRLTSATLSNTPVSFSYDNEGQQQAKASTNYTFFVFVTD